MDYELYGILISTDSGDTMALVLLDLSSAFDFVDVAWSTALVLEALYWTGFGPFYLIEDFRSVLGNIPLR